MLLQDVLVVVVALRIKEKVCGYCLF